MPLNHPKIYLLLALLNCVFWYGNFHFAWGHHEGLFQDSRGHELELDSGFVDFLFLGVLPLLVVLGGWISRRPSVSISQLEPYVRGLREQGWTVSIGALSTALELKRGDREGTLRLQFGTGVSRGPRQVRMELSCPSTGFPPDLGIVTEASRLPSLLDIALQSRRVTRSRLRPSGPADTRIGHHRLDDLLHFSSGDQTVLLERTKDEEVCSLLVTLMKDCEDFRVTPGRVEYRWKPAKKSVSHGDVGARLECLDELMWRLSGRFENRTAYQHPWKALAEGLGLDEDAVVLDPRRKISGRLAGYLVSIDEDVSEAGSGVRLQVFFRESMPSGFRVMKASPDAVSTIRLGNPILARYVVAYGRPDQRVRFLLEQVPVMEPLMALLNDCEEAAVREKRVEARCPAPVSQQTEIKRHLDMLLVLARALDEAALAS